MNIFFIIYLRNPLRWLYLAIADTMTDTKPRKRHAVKFPLLPKTSCGIITMSAADNAGDKSRIIKSRRNKKGKEEKIEEPRFRSNEPSGDENGERVTENRESGNSFREAPSENREFQTIRHSKSMSCLKLPPVVSVTRRASTVTTKGWEGTDWLDHINRCRRRTSQRILCKSS